MNILIFVIPVTIIAFFPVPAHAYLDVGSASMLLQMALAGIVGALVSIKIYWQRLSAFLRNLFSTNDSKGSE